MAGEGKAISRGHPSTGSGQAGHGASFDKLRTSRAKAFGRLEANEIAGGWQLVGGRRLRFTCLWQVGDKETPRGRGRKAEGRMTRRRGETGTQEDAQQRAAPVSRGASSRTVVW